MPDGFVGGFVPPSPSINSSAPGSALPTPPPKDDAYRPTWPTASTPSVGPQWSQATHEDPVAPEHYAYATQQLAHMTAVERSRNLRVARMDPILQFMAGPLLRYDTVDADGVWHGAALIVSELQSGPFFCRDD